MDLAKPFADDFSAETLTLFKTDHWSVLIRKGQVTLGSLVLAANRSFISAAELTPDELLEFPEVVGRLENILRAAFAYDKINYLCLMMVDQHYHFHVLPRYEQPREFQGVEWKDEAWPRPASIAVQPAEESLLQALKEHLQSFDR